MAKINSSNGYSGKPLKDKLGLKPAMNCKFFNPPPAYASWLGEKNALSSGNAPWDFVHVFTNSLEELEEILASLRKLINPDGMIWVSWHKKSSGLPTEISEDLIRDTCIPLGLVDVKVCAVSEIWSGLKLVIRKSLR